MSDFAEWRPCRVCGLPVALPKRVHDECAEAPDCPRCFGRGKLFMGPQAVLCVCPDCHGTGKTPLTPLRGSHSEI